MCWVRNPVPAFERLIALLWKCRQILTISSFKNTCAVLGGFYFSLKLYKISLCSSYKTNVVNSKTQFRKKRNESTKMYTTYQKYSCNSIWATHCESFVWQICFGNCVTVEVKRLTWKCIHLSNATPGVGVSVAAAAAASEMWGRAGSISVRRRRWKMNKDERWAKKHKEFEEDSA